MKKAPSLNGMLGIAMNKVGNGRKTKGKYTVDSKLPMNTMMANKSMKKAKS